MNAQIDIQALLDRFAFKVPSMASIDMLTMSGQPALDDVLQIVKRDAEAHIKLLYMQELQQREAILEDFLMSGAMPRDIVQVVTRRPVRWREPGQLQFGQPRFEYAPDFDDWRLN